MLADNKYVLIGVALAALALVVLVKKKGAAASLGSDIGHAAVDLATGTASGVINGVSTAIGIPTLDETLTDTGECRQFMNAYGVWESIGKCGAPAFTGAASGSIWDWLTTPSASDYKPVINTGAFDRQL